MDTNFDVEYAVTINGEVVIKVMTLIELKPLLGSVEAEAIKSYDSQRLRDIEVRLPLVRQFAGSSILSLLPAIFLCCKLIIDGKYCERSSIQMD